MSGTQKVKLVQVPSGAVIPERDAGKMPVLDARNLGIDFGGLTAVDEFSLTIGATEIAGLIGPNGAGKTTIFNLLTNVYQPTRGSVLLKGIDTKGMTTAQVNRLGIALTFQNIRLFNIRRRKSPTLDAWHCWTLWAWQTWQIMRPDPCLTALNAAWRSSGLWPPARPLSCWTSPPPA